METFIDWLLKSSEDFQFILYFGILGVLIIAELILQFRPVSKKKRWLANFALTLIAIVTMLALPISFISAARLATENQWGLLNIIEVYWIISFVLTMLLRGFISFITHYLMHKVPLFWRIHRVHHLDTEMDVSTTVRFHPFEFLVNICIGVPIIILFGFPLWPLLLYELLDIVITLISHSNIQMSKKLDSILRYIIVTPNLHRIHHSVHQPETDSNFSAVFPIWDILFGTFRTRTRLPSQSMELGLEEVRDDRTSNIPWLLLSPFKTFHKKRKGSKTA